jgi:hypothetical protein
MFIVRDVMHCKPGQVKSMVEKFRQLSKIIKKMGYKPMRIMTDISGERYWTVVAEQEVKNLEAYAEMAGKTMTDKNLQKVMKNYHDLVESGHREIFKLED